MRASSLVLGPIVGALAALVVSAMSGIPRGVAALATMALAGVTRAAARAVAAGPREGILKGEGAR